MLMLLVVELEVFIIEFSCFFFFIVCYKTENPSYSQWYVRGICSHFNYRHQGFKEVLEELFRGKVLCTFLTLSLLLHGY